MSDIFNLLASGGLVYGFLIGFISWALGYGLSSGLRLFSL